MADLRNPTMGIFLINPTPEKMAYAEELLGRCRHQEFLFKKLREAGIAFMLAEVGEPE